MKASSIRAIVEFLVVLYLAVPSAMAVQRDITVPDASFEDHVLAESGYVDIVAPGYAGAWKCLSGDAWVDYRYWAANGWPEDLQAHSGNNKVYPYEDYVYQILDETFIEGGTYTLSVWVGQPWVGSASGWQLSLTTEDPTNNLSEETGIAGLTWGQVSLTYTATAADVGKKIGIKIWGNEDVSFDDVTLSYEGPAGNRRATYPIPPDGSRAVATGTSGDGYYMRMSFTPGYGATTHTAYFSSSFDDVNDRNPAVRLGGPPYPEQPGYETTYFVGLDVPDVPEFARTPLERGVTYYWVVDESNDTDSYPGYVWSYTVATESAWNPTPAHNAQYIDGQSVVLSWERGDIADPGNYIISYNVYWGADEAAVANGTSDNVNVSATTHTIGPLAGDTDYYWKVDTVLKLNDPPSFPTTIVAGSVWHFKTMLSVPVVDEDLIGWWKLDGDIVPGMAFDSSGHSNHATLYGDPEHVPGRIDQALSFDASDDYAGTGKSLLSGLARFTLAAWVNAGNPAAGRVGLFGQNDVVEFGFQGGDIHCWTSGGGEARTAWTYGTDSWHHVTVVGDGTSLEIYVDGVIIATGGSPTNLYGSSSFAFNIGGGGVWDASGNWFFGQIDDVRVYKKALSSTEIKVVADLLGAAGPNPANGAVDVDRTPTLTWSPGPFAASAAGNRLYFSDDITKVARRDPSALVGTLSDPCYPVTTALDLGRTYYWAVDTVNDPCNWPGDLWTFKVVDWLTLDDMESYDFDPQLPADANWIFYVWVDGLGDYDCLGIGGNGTGANVYAQDVLFSGGQKGMRFDYNNDGDAENPCTGAEMPRAHKYSKAEAQIADLRSGLTSDWTAEGTKALSIRFYGDSLNELEPMWIELKDGTGGSHTVTYGTYAGEDPADILEASWHEWNIDLQDFAEGGVNLADVKSIAIGFGTVGATEPGGSGIVYFDDIRLYTPRCILSSRDAAFARADFAPLGAPDCLVNHRELEIMAGEWLIEATPPGTDNLVGWWKLDDAAGATAQDSSGHGNTGTLINMSPTSDWVAGKSGAALHFDGVDDYIDCGNGDSLRITGKQMSISAWIKLEVPEDWSAIAMKTTTGDWVDGYGLYAQANSVNFYVSNYENEAVKFFTPDDQWHHVVGTYDGSELRIWLDGVEGIARRYTGTISNADHSFEIGRGADDAYNFAGTIDDVRVYNVALTDDEVLSLFGLRADLYQDNKINFEDFAVLGGVWMDEDLWP